MKLIRSGLITTLLVLASSYFVSAQGTLWGVTGYGNPGNLGRMFSAPLDGSGLVGGTNFTNAIGTNPQFGLTRNGIKYYAVMNGGGAYGAGSLIEFDRPTGAITVKHSFTNTSSGGYWGTGRVAIADNTIYGTTGFSWPSGYGVLFSYNLSTSTYTVLHLFTNFPDGAGPRGGVQLMSNGKIYGTTPEGGNGGAGILYSYDPATSTYVKEVDFNSVGGKTPYSVPVELNGKLYGTTVHGGSSDGGILYEYDLATSTLSKKADFTTGLYPAGEMCFSPEGILYVTAPNGGAHEMGTIYSFDPGTGVLTTEYDFAEISTGAYPTGGLTFVDGKVYGNTVGGGATMGLIFQFDPATAAYSVLYDFSYGTGGPSYGGTLVYEPPISVPNVYVTTPVDLATGIMNSPNITARSVTGATTYEMQLSTSSSFATGTLSLTPGAKTQKFTGLDYGTTYYAHVRTNLSPEFGKTTSFTTLTAESLSYVVSPKDAALGATAVKLSVTSNSVPGATLYTIELNTDPGFGEGTAKVKSGATKTISFDSLVFNTVYYTRVKTNIPNSGWGATKSFTTMDASKLSYVTSPAKNAVNVKWDLDVRANRVLGAAEYTIQLSENTEFSGEIIQQVADTNVIHFSGLGYGITYHSRVKTNLSAENVWGEVRSFTTSSPVNVAKLYFPYGAENVNWSINLSSVTVPGATEYTIEVSENDDFSDAITHSGPTKSIPFLLKPSTYYYAWVKTDLLDEWGAVTAFTTKSSLPYAYMTTPAHGAENVSWLSAISINKVAGAAYYDIEIAADPDFAGEVQGRQLTNVLKTTFALEQSTEYFVRVHTDLEPGHGPVRSFTTGNVSSLAFIKAPVNEAVNVILSPKVSVNLVPGAPTKSYTIELNTQEDFEGASVMKAGSSTQTFTNLVGNTTYYARAKTTLSEEWGPVSSFTTMVPEAPPAQPPARVAQHDATAGDEESTVRVEEVNFVNSWPNPFTDRFTLRVRSATDSQIKVQMVDMAGRSMHNGLVKPNVEHTFGETWAPGVYLIRVTTGDKVQMEKVVKK